MSAHLKVVEGKPMGATIPLKGPAFVIGRDPSCQLRPKHESVGAKHCRIRVQEDRVSVRDLGSPTGTMLNGRKLSPADSVIALAGDHLQVGNLVFEVELDAPAHHHLTLDEALEDESPASALANRLIQQNLGAVPGSAVSSGTRLRLEIVEGMPVVTVNIPRIEGDSLLPFRRELRDLAERPSLTRVVLDFRKVRAVSMEGAVMLHAFHGRLKARGAVVKLCEVGPDVRRILDVEGISELIPIAFDTHDAIWSSW